MKTAILVVCSINHRWMTPEGAYHVKTGWIDGEFTPVKWIN